MADHLAAGIRLYVKLLTMSHRTRNYPLLQLEKAATLPGRLKFPLTIIHPAQLQLEKGPSPAGEGASPAGEGASPAGEADNSGSDVTLLIV
jgi:hypothetical protein